jgi:hypothetical protein
MGKFAKSCGLVCLCLFSSCGQYDAVTGYFAVTFLNPDSFLLGEHVEIERVEFGLRFVWVRGTIVDVRPPHIRARLQRNPRALDYLVREEDGEERWRADDGIRKRS